MGTVLLVIGIILLLCAAAIGVVLFAMLWRVKGEYLDVDGVRLHYTVQGQGTPVILLHGFAVHSDLNFRLPGVTRALAKEYKVIALDSRGHGLSGKPKDPQQYGIETIKDVIRLLDHLGIDKAHVVGYSMGGFMTLKVMAMYPDRVLSAAPCAAGWIQSTPDNEATSEELIKSLEAGKGLEPLNRRLRPGGKKLNPIVEKIVNLFVSILNDQRALANVVRGMREYTVTEAELRANRVPVLSIVGSRDPIGKTAKAMEGILGNYTLLVIQGADHMTTIRRPEFLAALRPFLAEHSPQAT